MKNNLSDKLEQVTAEHENELTAELAEQMTLRESMDFAERVGGVKTLTTLARKMIEVSIVELAQIEEERRYRAYGFKNMADFLASSPAFPGKSAYYEQKKVLQGEGEVTFNLLNESKVPFTDRKLLAGQVEVKGNTVRIGEASFDIGDSTGVKSAVRELADIVRETANDKEKAEKKIEHLEKKIETGQKEFDELDRAYQTLNESDPHTRALSKAISSLIQLNMEVDALEAAPADPEHVLNTLWFQINELRKKYGLENYQFEGTAPSTNGTVSKSKKLKPVLRFDDENEK
jgi:flagellar biosynthesis chaperone FliJ